jgi:putative transposase
MLRRYQYRLYPTKDQETLIARHLGCCRYVYNWALDLKNRAYHDDGTSLSRYDLMNRLPALKEELPWLKEVNAQSLQQSIIHLSRAFTNFFEGRAEEPTFKKKHDPEQSFTVPQSYTVDFQRGTVKLPKISAIKTVFHRAFGGTKKSATVIRKSTGRYFISIVVEDGQKPLKPADPIPDQTVGIDMGLSHYAVLSTGDAVANPKCLRNAQTRLAVLQRRLDRKKNGSKNRNKARLKVARCRQTIADQRRDFQHQLSSRLVRENQALAVESLNVNGMLKSGRGAKRQAPLADNAPQRVVTLNHKLARAIGDAGWGTFLSMLAYKCQEAGKTLLKIGVFEPSSKTCSVCGYRKADLTLKDREWTCPDCGTCHDRDLNAAINIKQFALAGAERAEEPVDSLPMGRGMKQEAPCGSGG